MTSKALLWGHNACLAAGLALISAFVAFGPWADLPRQRSGQKV